MSIDPLVGLSHTLPLRQPQSENNVASTQSFADFINSSIARVNDSLNQSDKAVEQLHTGEAENLHDVMIAVEQADISLRMLVQVRNKALQAYEEIIRLQI